MRKFNYRPRDAKLQSFAAFPADVIALSVVSVSWYLHR